MIDDIIGLIGDVTKIVEHLTAAKARQDQGLPLTPEQRAARDAARKLVAGDILADIKAQNAAEDVGNNGPAPADAEPMSPPAPPRRK